MATGSGNGVAKAGSSENGELRPGSKLWEALGKYTKVLLAVVIGTATTVGGYYALLNKVAAAETKSDAAVADVKEVKQLVLAHDRAIVELQTQAKSDAELKKLLKRVLKAQGDADEPGK